MSWGKDKAEKGITKAGAMTPEEQAAMEQRARVDKSLENYYMGNVNVSPEQAYKNQGELAQTVYGQTLSEAKAPEDFYTSTLTPQLKLAEDYINNKMQKRGLLRSGMNIEDMGRAGVELAIGEANARMGARANALNRASALSQYTSGMRSEDLGRLAEIAGRTGSISETAKGRAATYESAPYEAQLSDIYGRQAAMYALPGQLIGAVGDVAAGVATGGASVPFSAAKYAKNIGSGMPNTQQNDYMTALRSLYGGR